MPPLNLDALDLEEAFRSADGAPLIVAFSGGGDSTALLHLLAAQARGRPLSAVIIDHAIREASAAEAARAAAHARALGVAAYVARLSWPAHARKSQAAARRARYVALCKAARSLGASVVAVAHTADDQAETVRMRLARVAPHLTDAPLEEIAAVARSRGAARALAGMARHAPAPLWPEGRGVALVRPLLSVTRAALRDWLRARAAEWIDDPANADARYERVRVRRALQGALRLSDLARLLRADADGEDQSARAWIADHAHIEDGVISYARAAAPPPRALAAMLAAVSGADTPRGSSALAPLAEEIARAAFAGRSAAGCRIARVGQSIRLERDPGAVLGRAGRPGLAPLALVPGVPMVWDGRLELTAHAPGVSAAPDPAQPHAPLLRRAGAPIPLSGGLVSARWLLSQHISHILFTPP